MSPSVSETTLLLSSAPCFVVEGVVRTAEHYRDKLGFTIEHYEGRPPRRARLTRGAVRIDLQLSEAAPPGPNRDFVTDGVDLRIEVDDAQALYHELVERDANVITEPTAGLGPRQFRVRDCNGLVLCFVEG